MKASIGRIVIVNTATDYNGTYDNPAIVTRVWSTTEPQPITEARPDGTQPGYANEAVMVNVTLFGDARAPSFIGSIPLFHDKGSAGNSGHLGTYGYWPERV